MSGRLRRVAALSRKLGAALREPSYRRPLLHGVAAGVEHEAVPFGQDFRTVVDVGANRGQFALVVRRRFPQARLICLEPLPSPRRALERVFDADRHFEVLPFAAAATDGEAEFVVSRAEDSSSLLPMTELQARVFGGTAAVSRTTVRTRRLDGLLDPAALAPPVLLKIDVQGAELEVLRGASGVLDATDEVLAECSFAELYRGQALAHEVIRFLHDRGFAVAAVCAPVCDDRDRVLQADLLFVRQEEGGGLA